MVCGRLVHFRGIPESVGESDVILFLKGVLMGPDISEADWRIFKALMKLALDRYCARVLVEMKGLIDDPSQTNHERYLSVFRQLHERNEDLARAFDGLSRPKAVIQLMLICRLNLVTEDELSKFNPPFREQITNLLSFSKEGHS